MVNFHKMDENNIIFLNIFMFKNKKLAQQFEQVKE